MPMPTPDPAAAHGTADAPPPVFTIDDLPPAGTDYAGSEFLRSRRMRLQGFAFRHVIDLLQLGREERVSRMLLDDPIATLDDAMGLVVWANKLYRERPGLGLWHTRDRAGRFIGMFSLTPSGDGGAIAIGVRLLPSAWGRGYAIEGGAALCAHAFDTLQLPGLIAQCAPGNRSVPPLLLRLGFEETVAGTQFGNPARRFRIGRGDWRGLRPRRQAPAKAPSSG